MFQNDLDLDLGHFFGNMFYVWENNLHLLAWWRHMNKLHSLDKDRHIYVNYIVMYPRNFTSKIFIGFCLCVILLVFYVYFLTLQYSILQIDSHFSTFFCHGYDY
jgi:hypothetical protein